MYNLFINMKALIQTFLKIILPLFFGVLLLWYLYKEIDFIELMNVIKSGVRYDILFLSLLFGLFANIVRGFRWGLLIRSIGEKVSYTNTILAVLGNYAVNLLLPRVGEIWRCGIIKKYDKISFPKLLGTLLIDRVSDTVMVSSATVLIFFFNTDFFINFFSKNPSFLQTIEKFLTSAWIYVILISLIAVVYLIFKYLGELMLVRKTKEMLLKIFEGIKSIAVMERKWLFIIQTFLIWIGYFFFFYTTFYAFEFTTDLGINVGLVTFIMSSIAVAAPVQGAIGPWHFMVIATLVCYKVDATDAAAFALVVHTVQTVWTGLCGVLGIVMLPIMNKKTN